MMNGIDTPHIVAVPFPALGHAIPLLDCATLLASHGLIVTCVTTPANLPRLQHQVAHAISSGLNIRFLVLPTPVVEDLPEGVESFDQATSVECHRLIYELVVKLEHPFNRWLEKEGTEAPVCVLHDVLLGWSMEVPQKLNIPTVVFNTYGAFGLSLLHSAWLSSTHNALEKQGDTLVLSSNLPNPLRLHKHEIDPYLLEPIFADFLRRFQSINQGWGMLVNTFEELEPEYVQNLRNMTGKKVWPIGPVLPLNSLESAVKISARGKKADISDEELMQWLDSQRSCSVVYVSFGSQISLREEQSKALAESLEASEQPFIWAFKLSPKIHPVATNTPSDVACTYLPEGFRERTKNRGLVIWGWVPQLAILSHPSVGAFMSHCGWNSMLESITLGVPLITWPMVADQFFNSKLAVESGIGIQVCEYIHGIPDKQRVKDAVILVLSKEEGKKMKRDAEKLKEMAREAVAYRGSSSTNLLDFVSEIHRLGMARNSVACGGSLKADDLVSEIHKVSISNSAV